MLLLLLLMLCSDFTLPTEETDVDRLLEMEDLRTKSGAQDAALVILTFLQLDCGDKQFERELCDLLEDISPLWDTHSHGAGKDAADDGRLETDGHLSCSIAASLSDIRPSVELQRPWNPQAAAELHRVALDLREIADHLELSVVAQATQNLNRNISSSLPEQWKEHLSREVEGVMRRTVGLESLAHERVIMALTLTLVRGVCTQAPQLLRGLFRATMQYISLRGGR